MFLLKYKARVNVFYSQICVLTTRLLWRMITLVKAMVTWREKEQAGPHRDF